MNGYSSSKKQLKLADFDISEVTGFLPEVLPLRRLPGEYFSSWEDTCDRIPALLESKQVRNQVDSLPERDFSHNTLKSDRELWRALVLVSFLAQAYIWVEGETGVVDKLPRKLAVPLWSLAERLSISPIFCYALGALHNFTLRDPNGKWSAENLVAISTYTGTEDESWFYVIFNFLELTAVPGLKAIVQAYSAMETAQDSLLVEDLEIVTKTLLEMTAVLKRMYERCDPKVFYLGIRPYQSGSKGCKAFPNGIVYEGVDSKPKSLHGASAGQTSSVPSFDRFLRAQHSGSDQEFLLTMREYMPGKHREFLETLDHLPSVRDYVINSNNPLLVKQYNLAVEAFGGFRSEHIIMVVRYIVSQKKHSVNASLESTGTGGTPFMQFLKQVRDDTLATEVSTKTTF